MLFIDKILQDEDEQLDYQQNTIEMIKIIFESQNFFPALTKDQCMNFGFLVTEDCNKMSESIAEQIKNYCLFVKDVVVECKIDKDISIKMKILLFNDEIFYVNRSRY